MIKALVGARGFEPPTTCTPCRCATRLRYAPVEANIVWLLNQKGILADMTINEWPIVKRDAVLFDLYLFTYKLPSQQIEHFFQFAS